MESMCKRDDKREWPVSESAGLFWNTHYSEVDSACWTDWRWQLRHRFTTLSDIRKCVPLAEQQIEAFSAAIRRMPFAVTPYYAALLKTARASSALLRTVIPSPGELLRAPEESADPLGEDSHMPLPGLVHTYPDKVLVLLTDRCATYCRYCTRARRSGKCKWQRDAAWWAGVCAYLRAHREVRDVLLSGGDPLILSSARLDRMISALRRIEHIELIRIGTKMPVVLPYRITQKLLDVLHRHQPLWLSLHFTHPAELTEETTEACRRLADAGVPMGSQTVLLQGVNDDAAVARDLFTGLLRLRVRPYYLLQCDVVEGSRHFRTPLSRGVDIIRALHGYTTGYAIPTFMVDAPGGGGKIPLMPDYVVQKNNHHTVLKNYQGRHYRYPNNATPEFRNGTPNHS